MEKVQARINANNDLKDYLETIAKMHDTKIRLLELKVKSQNGIAIDPKTEPEQYRAYQKLKIERKRLQEKEKSLERTINDQRRKQGLKSLKETLAKVSTSSANKKADLVWEDTSAETDFIDLTKSLLRVDIKYHLAISEEVLKKLLMTKY